MLARSASEALRDHVRGGRAVHGPSACRADRRGETKSRGRPRRAASRTPRHPSRCRRPHRRPARRKPRPGWKIAPRPASAGRPIDRPDRTRRRSRSGRGRCRSPGFPQCRESSGYSHRPRRWRRHRCRRRGDCSIPTASRPSTGICRGPAAVMPELPALAGLGAGNWTRTGPLRLKCLGSAGLFRPNAPVRAAIADPARPRSQTLSSARNLVGCHGISSVNGVSAAPQPVRHFTT